METSAKSPTQHIGRKISRMREMLGVKQEALAQGLGISQQAVSKLEQSEKLEDERLEEVAKVLGVSSEAIKHFNENAVHFHIENMHDNSSAYNYQCTINPVDKLFETLDENKRLYEALIKEKDEKIALMERLLGKK